MNRVALAIATFGYVGFFPVAPGTAGSAAALLLYALVRAVGLPAADAVAVIVVFLTGVWAATRTEAVLGTTDPGPVVIDEVLGMLITLAWLPLSPLGIFVGFVLFRIFDVIKPYPARRLEDAPGGWGIMLDDAMAGVYSHVTLRAMVWAWPQWMAV